MEVLMLTAYNGLNGTEENTLFEFTEAGLEAAKKEAQGYLESNWFGNDVPLKLVSEKEFFDEQDKENLVTSTGKLTLEKLLTGYSVSWTDYMDISLTFTWRPVNPGV